MCKVEAVMEDLWFNYLGKNPRNKIAEKIGTAPQPPIMAGASLELRI